MVEYSNCCNAAMFNYPDSDICPSCGEHAEIMMYEECMGEGE